MNENWRNCEISATICFSLIDRSDSECQRCAVVESKLFWFECLAEFTKSFDCRTENLILIIMRIQYSLNIIFTFSKSLLLFWRHLFTWPIPKRSLHFNCRPLNASIEQTNGSAEKWWGLLNYPVDSINSTVWLKKNLLILPGRWAVSFIGFYRCLALKLRFCGVRLAAFPNNDVFYKQNKSRERVIFGKSEITPIFRFPNLSKCRSARKFSIVPGSSIRAELF